MGVSIAELAERIDAELIGDGSRVVTHCAGLVEADERSVSFLSNRRYTRQLKKTRAGAVVVSPKDVPRAEHLNRLVSDDPYFAFRQTVVLLHGFRPRPEPGVSELAVVSPEATLGARCSIQPFAVIEAGAELGPRCVVYPHAHIGRRARLGADCVIFPNVCIYEDCVLGDRVTVHAGSVIGQDGFGYATHEGLHHKIPHIGNVVIGDDVELGAGCAIDRGTFRATEIGAGTKLSDLVVIGHNAIIGPHNLIVAQVGVAGSAQTGTHVVIGGQSGIVGHIGVGDRAQIAARTGVVQNIPPGKQYGGYVAVPLDDAKKIGWQVVHLPDLVDEVQQLRQRVAELEERDQAPTAGGDD